MKGSNTPAYFVEASVTRKKFYGIVTWDSDAAAQDALDPEGEVGEDLESFLEKNYFLVFKGLAI